MVATSHLMAKGKYLFLEVVRTVGQIEQFCRERLS